MAGLRLLQTGYGFGGSFRDRLHGVEFDARKPTLTRSNPRSKVANAVLGQYALPKRRGLSVANW